MSARPPLPLSPTRPESRLAERLSEEEAAVIRAIRSTAFGAIEVLLHQARIVQVVRSEKTRFDAP